MFLVFQVMLLYLKSFDHVSGIFRDFRNIFVWFYILFMPISSLLMIDFQLSLFYFAAVLLRSSMSETCPDKILSVLNIILLNVTTLKKLLFFYPQIFKFTFDLLFM